MSVPPRVGRWRVARPLGEGGAASVYLAEREGERAAIKFFPRIQASADEFRREAATLSRSRHPNLVGLVDSGFTEEAVPWLALEFVDGPDLRTRLDDGPAIDVLPVALGVFAALDALHRGGLAHGDIKPENVIVPGDAVRIVDFGRTRMHHLFGGAGVFPGTPPYMHPTLFHGGTPNARTDCFAAWVMVHEIVAGSRPFRTAELRSAYEALPERPPLIDRDLDALVAAGLDGRLADARACWVALERFRRGLPTVLPALPSAGPVVSGPLIDQVRKMVHRRRSLAVVGDAEQGRPVLEAVHRSWEDTGGSVLWVRGEGPAPLSAALALAGQAADAFDGRELEHIAAALGPVGGALAEALPSARAWLPPPPAGDTRPAAERILVALTRFVIACPRPLLVVADGLDEIDGSSRRFLASLATTGDGVVLGTARPGAPHGLPGEVVLPLRPTETAPVPLPAPSEEICCRAMVLDLPFDTSLAVAAGVDPARVEVAALDAEVVGRARWNGVEVVARSLVPPSVEVTRTWFREAANRLDPATDPVRVARFARLGGDGERLAAVVDRAVDEALRFDPRVALELLDHDPRAPDAGRALRHFRVAMLARDMPRAARLLRDLASVPGVEEADRAEAEGEYAFRVGDSVTALSAYGRAARALGRPVRTGLVGFLEDLLAFWRMLRGHAAPPRPDARLARVFEHLYDLQFNHDNAPMLRIHGRWREAAPEAVRARAMEMVWATALGLGDRAADIEADLGGRIREDTDPVGAAVVLEHRAIARLWRGDVVAAHQDAVDAAERLVRAGDPYLGALACVTLAATTFHLGTAGALMRLFGDFTRLVKTTGDVRAATWAAGCAGVLEWSVGHLDQAIGEARRWAAEAASREDSGEALARRFLADLLLEKGEWEAAGEAIDACRRCIRRYHLRLDYTDAVLIAEGIAAAQSRIAGHRRGVGWFWRRRLHALVARSPRWGPRALAAEAWRAVADGKVGQARTLFARALAEAEARHQHQDAWWVQVQRGLALRDDEVLVQAGALARRHGLKAGYEAIRP